MMEKKYSDLIKTIAGIISDNDREIFYLRNELERVKKQLKASEAKVEELVAQQALSMMVKEEKRNA